MDLKAVGLTHVGRQRQHNEDSYLVADQATLFLVADGMGGHAAGEIASRIAVDSISEFILHTKEDDGTWPHAYDEHFRRTTNRLMAAVRLANTRVLEAMRKDARLRGMGGDLPLMRGLTEVGWPAEARLEAPDVRVGMLAGGLEMLRHGVTTSTEMYFWADTVVDAVLELGSRVVMTPGIITAPGMDRLGTWEQMRDAISRWIDADGLRFGPGERVALGYGAHSAYTLSPEAVATTAAAAQERDALLHIHVAEARGEDDEVRSVYGSVPAMLETTGSLDGRVLAAHAIQLSDSDLEIFARHDVAVAHCPGSNAKLAAGVARYLEKTHLEHDLLRRSDGHHIDHRAGPRPCFRDIVRAIGRRRGGRGHGLAVHRAPTSSAAAVRSAAIASPRDSASRSVSTPERSYVN